MTFFLAISALVCAITFTILKNRLGLSKKGNRWLLLFFVLSAVIMVVAPLEYRTGTTPPVGTPVGALKSTLQWVQFLLMGWIGVILLNFIFVEILQFGLRFAKPAKGTARTTELNHQNLSRRIFLTEGVARMLVGASTVAATGGYLQAKGGPKVNAVTISPKGLPPEFDGLSLAQISDVHIGPLLHRDFLQNVVDQVMALHADIILITGDLVDGTVDQLRDFVEPLKQLKAKEGIYFCTGNHEYYAGANEWMEYLESIGIHVFRNSNKILSRPSASGKGTAEILLGGVYDWHAGRFYKEQTTDPFLAAKASSPVSCKILIAHNPYSIEEAAAAGFNLQISGHTHAGQFYPFVFIVKLALKHVEGLYQINENTQLYVNRGTGYWGPPNRLGKWSEITHFTLKA